MWLDIRRASPRETSDTAIVTAEIRAIDAGFGVRITDASHNDPAPRTIISNVDITPFQSFSLEVDVENLSNPIEQMISFRGCWHDAREHFAPIVRLGSSEALHSPDRRLCVFVDTATKSVYASTFVQEAGKEIVCATPPGSFPQGRTCDVSVRASTALGYMEIELDKMVTSSWWDANGRMCVAEPRVLVGAPSAHVTVGQIELSRLIF